MIEAILTAVSLIAILAWRWGTTRSIKLDDRGPTWDKSYQMARSFGPGVGIVSLFTLIALLASKCGS